MTDDELIARSRLAVSQSFATLARVPELSMVGPPACPWQAEDGRSSGRGGPPCSPRNWLGLEVPSNLRFFFDVDDGEVVRRDEVGVVLSSEDDVSRETKLLLTDLAYAALPGGRPRMFIARVRDSDGKCVYEGSAQMRPLPITKPRRDRDV